MIRLSRRSGLASYTLVLGLVSLAPSLHGWTEARAAHDLIAVSGELLPGGGGAQLQGVSALSLNEAGYAAFRGTLKHGVTGVGTTNDKVVWISDGVGDSV